MAKINASVVIYWILSIIFFFFGGIFILGGEFFAGFSLLIPAIILLPPLTNYFKNQLKIKIPTVFKVVITLFWFVIFVIIVGNMPDKIEVEGEEKIELIEKIAQEYHDSHIYSEMDFFVCADMANDMWNILRAQGINVMIAAGNTDINISEIESNYEFYANINHAWLLTEIEPFKWVGVETTGGYLVFKEENPLYFSALYFDNPSEFKKFIKLRDDYLEICTEASELSDLWEIKYEGEPLTHEISEFKGKMNSKISDCYEKANSLEIITE